MKTETIEYFKEQQTETDKLLKFKGMIKKKVLSDNERKRVFKEFIKDKSDIFRKFDL